MKSKYSCIWDVVHSFLSNISLDPGREMVVAPIVRYKNAIALSQSSAVLVSSDEIQSFFTRHVIYLLSSFRYSLMQESFILLLSSLYIYIYIFIQTCALIIFVCSISHKYDEICGWVRDELLQKKKKKSVCIQQCIFFLIIPPMLYNISFERKSVLVDSTRGKNTLECPSL